MTSYSRIIEVASIGKTDMLDISQEVNTAVVDSGIRHGIASVMPLHTTTAVRVNENEPRLLADLKTYLDCLVPCGTKCLHDDIDKRPVPEDEKINGRSHILSFILGISETLPVIDGRMHLGQWQSVFFVDFDGPQKRKVLVTVVGDR